MDDSRARRDEQLEAIEGDLNTVEAALEALDTGDPERAEALAADLERAHSARSEGDPADPEDPAGG